MTEEEKALAGLFYQADEKEIEKERICSQELSYAYNQIRPAKQKERTEYLKRELGKTGEHIRIEQPFHCDFWKRVSMGDHFFANYNFTILAGNYVTFGEHVMFGPNCGIYAAGHPFSVEDRNSSIEYAWPVKIGNNVWVGGHVSIVGGVSIGDNTIIAAGSVVTQDIPANVLAGGNPCRVIRTLKKEDDAKYRAGFQGFSN